MYSHHEENYLPVACELHLNQSQDGPYPVEVESISKEKFTTFEVN
jgi:hypothetical protein